jgi:hypothetical protein
MRTTPNETNETKVTAPIKIVSTYGHFLVDRESGLVLSRHLNSVVRSCSSYSTAFKFDLDEYFTWRRDADRATCTEIDCLGVSHNYIDEDGTSRLDPYCGSWRAETDAMRMDAETFREYQAMCAKLEPADSHTPRSVRIALNHITYAMWRSSQGAGRITIRGAYDRHDVALAALDLAGHTANMMDHEADLRDIRVSFIINPNEVGCLEGDLALADLISTLDEYYC